MFPSVGKQQQMCGVSAVVSHVLYGDLPDRCDLSVAWGKEHFSPLTFTPATLVQNMHSTTYTLCRLFTIPSSDILFPLFRIF